ncbi:nitronate monooxygenase [Pseudosulfitobacter sp. DSM 107133]|uniref:NAD(P)H-dependent flavin oxidoreductase n=1 Tax=Pseudosulfitobacter sp. DSM 107133 TaxID=2883100 RepID=UPI000DF25587|nr:nitronate monooxygenase [Pseudosulfitobacter sp. DSM 107133]UOA27867.1 Putative monooxygenase [Pseudosulfitobacter sp. DSM 107133]
MWPDNQLRDLFSIDLPIIQAPMAGSSSIDMAVAVNAAGGLGSLACATLDADQLRILLVDAQNRTDKPLNVNFFAHTVAQDDAEHDAAWLDRLSPYYAEFGLDVPKTLSAGPIQPFDAARCEVVEEFAPSVVSFHFGLPEPELVSRVKAAGCKIISSATTVNEARWLATHGCDAIIAQGFEAGGHRGMFLTESLGSQMGTLSLVPQIADAVDLPVIAAGGIGDARGIVAAFALGASAVQIGTAYLFTDEASISPAYRQSLENAANIDTLVSNVISGRPTRVLANRMVTELGPVAQDAPAFPRGFSAAGPLKSAAEGHGNRDFSAHYCGQAAALAHRTTAFSLTRELASRALQNFGSANGAAR